MSQGRGTVREIAWNEVFPWLILLRTLRLAINFRILLLAALALLAIVAGWRMIGAIFHETEDVVLRTQIESRAMWPWEMTLGHEVSARAEALPIVGPWLVRGPIVQTWLYLSGPFRMLFDPQLQPAGLAYALLCALWAALVWAFFGGAASRIATLALTRSQPVGLGSALNHARIKLPAYLLAPLMPLVGVFFLSLLMALVGLLLRTDVGTLLVGIVWPLMLVLGLLITILLLGLLFGWPLMWPTISTEGTDAFDALSRSYAYIYQRPLRVVIYAFIVSLLGLVGVVLFDLFAASVVHFSLLPVSWGAGDERMGELLRVGAGLPENEVTDLGRSGWNLIRFWNGLVQALTVAFQLAFFVVSAAAIYLLLRREVDATDMDEVFLEEPLGSDLPPLENDAQGVPGVKE